MTLPPFPDAWDPIEITLTPAEGGAVGVLRMGAAEYHIDGWHRGNDGKIRARSQGVRDAVWEGWLARVKGSVEA